MTARACFAATAALLFGPAASASAQTYQVWAADQNGNLVYVLDPDGRVLRTLDSTALGNARRPHMLWGVAGDPYVYSANTVSNSVTVLSRADGSVKAVVPHATVGETPGVSIIDVAKRQVIQVVKLGNQETGDFHGVFIP